MQYAKKSGKLIKLRKLKNKKLTKFKKLLKSKNLPNLSAKKARPRFLIFDTEKNFNHLCLAFTKVSIL